MDKNSIKKFAVWARTELITRVSQRAIIYEIDENGYGEYDADAVNGRVMSAEEKTQRKALIDRIRKKGYHQVMEEVAYTWFNRFSALRFMEVNGYLPSRTRVFTDENNNFKPQIITDAIDLTIDGLDMEKVYELKDDAKKEEELYKYLLITQCNALNPILPGMFQKISDYTELLFPDNLLRENSVIQKMIELIPQQDWEEQVEILGWLYQYYINEPKDKLINAKKQYKLDDVPFVTQIFTSDWIVQYMVQNSLGRMWINAGDKDLKDYDWDYYLQERDGAKKDASIDPSTIKVIDPCMGSGHIIAYIFDALIQMYDNYGYTRSDAVESILQNNIYGMDISERAYQLAYFSLMMKARKYSRTILNKRIKPHLYCLENVLSFREELVDFVANGDLQVKKDILLLQQELEFLGEYGSLVETSSIDYSKIEQRINEIENTEYDNLIDQGYRLECINDVRSMIETAKSLNMKYDSVITNPPYIGNKFLPARLKDYIEKNYKDYKSDIFAAFIARIIHMTKLNGNIGMLTPYVWMFISTYEELRRKVLNETQITSLVQLEYNAFEAACVPVCSFTLKKTSDKLLGEYVRLSEFKGADIQGVKVIEAVNNRECGYRYTTDQRGFDVIPGAPVAYWVDKRIVENFNVGTRVDTFAFPKQGLATADNNRFLRLWFEVSIDNIGLGYKNAEDAAESCKKWFPYNKGGGFKKWYGNNEYVINWENNGSELRNFKGSVIRSPQYYFQEGISWCKITSSDFSMRYIPNGFLFDVAGCTLFVEKAKIKYMLGYMNSKINAYILGLISPTLNFEVGHIGSLPIIFNEEYRSEVEKLVSENIELCKSDWDSYENSWDFKKSPLLTRKGKLSEIYNEYVEEKIRQFDRLKANEIRINEIFANIYGADQIVSSIVDDEEVIIGSPDYKNDMKALISYAVGCMFGRYSLDKNGVICAGNEFNIDNYRLYNADLDNIIPICNDDYFEDDILGRFVEFVKTAFGKDDLENNLDFIAKAFNNKGTSREVLRQYFINDFYTDHCNLYTSRGAGKRPIYWLFDSGKKNGFKCLIYMHRYQPDTIARIRTDYVHEQQSRYRTAVADIEQRLMGASGSEKVKLDKQKATLQAQITEIGEYEERIHHLADQMIRIDLDDGVKNNYEIFKDVLAKIK